MDNSMYTGATLDSSGQFIFLQYDLNVFHGRLVGVGDINK